MEIIPWKPFSEVSSLRKEMDNLWNNFLGDTTSLRSFSKDWLPSVDVSETDDQLRIMAELPGLDAKDINVSISGDMLTVKGEKKKEEEREDEHFYSSERYYGSFQRSFRLPSNIKTDEVDATFNKGVLQLTLRKTEESKKKDIEIKVK
jgi:HSP20 family protein